MKTVNWTASLPFVLCVLILPLFVLGLFIVWSERPQNPAPGGNRYNFITVDIDQTLVKL